MGKSGELQQWNAKAFHTPASPEAGMRPKYEDKISMRLSCSGSLRERAASAVFFFIRSCGSRSQKPECCRNCGVFSPFLYP
jgi:hypothetical protein